MAHIGMKYPVAATWTEGNKYADGFVLAKAINFTGTPNKNDADLWADDGIAETDKSVKDMGTSLGVDDLSLENQAKLLGHTYVKAAAGSSGGEGTPESIEIGTEDEAPFFGVGFYKRRKKNGVTSFTVIWLYKVQHSEPTENAETKGDTTAANDIYAQVVSQIGGTIGVDSISDVAGASAAIQKISSLISQTLSLIHI